MVESTTPASSAPNGCVSILLRRKWGNWARFSSGRLLQALFCNPTPRRNGCAYHTYIPKTERSNVMHNTVVVKPVKYTLKRAQGAADFFCQLVDHITTVQLRTSAHTPESRQIKGLTFALTQHSSCTETGGLSCKDSRTRDQTRISSYTGSRTTICAPCFCLHQQP